MAASMPTSKLDDKILAPLAGIWAKSRIMTIQVNFIPGWYLPSICASHSITDASGMYLIVANLTQHCRRAQALNGEAITLNGENKKHGIPHRLSSIPL